MQLLNCENVNFHNGYRNSLNSKLVRRNHFIIELVLVIIRIQVGLGYCTLSNNFHYNLHAEENLENAIIQNDTNTQIGFY